MSRLLLRLALFAFAAFFVSIVVIADRGQGGIFWNFIHQIPYGDKVGHIGLLGTFSLLLNLVLAGRRAPGRLSGMMLGSLLLAIAMTLEEGSQAFIPSRSFDVVDWLANLAGIALGELLVRTILRRKRVRSIPSC